MKLAKGDAAMKLWLSIVWPSFLAAAAAEGAFFSVFDPADLLMQLSWTWLALPAIAIYTIGFFFFWIFCTLASLLTCYLVQIPDDA